MSKCGSLPSVSEMPYRVCWPWGGSLNRVCLDLFTSGLWERNWATEIRLQRHEGGKCECKGVLECTLYLRHLPTILILYFQAFTYPRQNQYSVFFSQSHIGTPCLALWGNWWQCQAQFLQHHPPTLQDKIKLSSKSLATPQYEVQWGYTVHGMTIPSAKLPWPHSCFRDLTE